MIVDGVSDSTWCFWSIIITVSRNIHNEIGPMKPFLIQINFGGLLSRLWESPYDDCKFFLEAELSILLQNHSSTNLVPVSNRILGHLFLAGETFPVIGIRVLYCPGQNSLTRYQHRSRAYRLKVWYRFLKTNSEKRWISRGWMFIIYAIGYAFIRVSY